MGSLPKILLLDPPAPRPLLRDYYCSSRPKARYRWQPIDLLALAALLRGRARLLVLDAQARRLGPRSVRRLAEDFGPDTVFCLLSRAGLEEETAFLGALAAGGRRIVIGGEPALDPAFDFAAHPFIEGTVPDFSAPEGADFLLGDAARGRVATAGRKADPPAVGGRFSLGTTPHEELGPNRYRLPLWGKGFFSLLTDFGCPFSCSFCNSGAHSLGYKEREFADLEQEVLHLKRLGARRVYLRDMTFGARSERALEVLKLLARGGFELRGYLRPDLVTPALAGAMARAGFTIAQLGIERPDDRSRAELGKKFDDEKVERAVAVLSEHGVQSGFHFLVGLDGDPPKVSFECASYAARRGACYCSINVFEPRLGAPDAELTRGGALHRPAAKTAMVWFHGRSSYLLKRVSGAFPFWRGPNAPRSRRPGQWPEY